MKKIIINILLITLVVSSCKKDDTRLFEKTADERLAETLAAYQSQLVGATNGWKGYITTDSGKGATYSFYFKFNDQNRVQMYSDFDITSATTLLESSYRLKALQQPSLIFDTYSYVHRLADPTDSINNGTLGVGLVSDFEFAFDNTSPSADTIKLIGRIHGSKASLVRATQQEATAFNNKQLGNSLAFHNLKSKVFNYWKQFTVAGTTYEIDDPSFDTVNRKVTISYLDAGGAKKSITTGYYFTIAGVTFTTPIVSGTSNFNGLTNLNWNGIALTLSASVNNTSTTIAGAIKGIFIDTAAPRRWRQYAIDNGNGYWISAYGFHSNGIDDAFRITRLTSGTNTYYYLLYWPLYGPNYDLFAPVFLNAAQTGLTLIYGTAPRVPTFTTDGRIVFSELGILGPYPTSGAAAQSRALLYNPSGYYLVQIDEKTYDMVSAIDGKSWVRWEWIF